MITNETRLSVLKKASEATFELYSSIETATLLGSLRRKYNLQNGDSFIDLVGDIILGLIPKSDLKTQLVSSIRLSPEVADSVAFDLKDFLSKVAESTPTAVVQKPLQPEAPIIPKATPPPSTTHETSFGAKPLTREEVLRALTPKRTMANDVASAQQQSSVRVPVSGFEARGGEADGE